MNSGMQDAQNLAWKLAFALKGGNIEQLLDSYDQERRPAITSFVLPVTTYWTRTVMTASQRRIVPIALWAGGLALRNSRIRRAFGRGAAMLGTHYNKSPLISGEQKWAGRRAPGGPLPEPTIISFGASTQILREIEQAMIQLNSDRGLPAVTRRKIEETKPVWRRWRGRSNLVVFVRPDGYVGWAAFSPTAAETLSGVRQAIGCSSTCNARARNQSSGNDDQTAALDQAAGRRRMTLRDRGGRCEFRPYAVLFGASML